MTPRTPSYTPGLQGMAGCTESSRCAWLRAWARACGSIDQWDGPGMAWMESGSMDGKTPSFSRMMLIIKLCWTLFCDWWCFCKFMDDWMMEAFLLGFCWMFVARCLSFSPKSSGETLIGSRWFTWWSFDHTLQELNSWLWKMTCLLQWLTYQPITCWFSIASFIIVYLI